MIRLFLADIDGCLSEPYTPYDWDGFAQLREWSAHAANDARYPRLGLCSGRSYAYVEAMAQALGLTAPALFESGGGRFDLPDARIAWNPRLTPEVERELEAARRFLLEHVVPTSSTISFDYGKRSQAGIVSPTVGECETHLPAVAAFLAGELPDLTAFHTPYSIDIVPAGLTKADALRWLAEEEGLTLDELAFIGDTNGDAAAMQAAGAGFSPSNGSEAAKAAADVVTEGAVLAGTLDAYRWCLRRNGVNA
ncbi:MAG: HAD hydrolase family protein [Bacteroidota bacterium]